MELVYLWVEDYKNIKKQGFNFSPRFRCEYDDVNNELTIDENDDYIPDFFGENINVTAIVGKNGSGKSSITESIAFNHFTKLHNDKAILFLYYDKVNDEFFKYFDKIKKVNIKPKNFKVYNLDNKYYSDESVFQDRKKKYNLFKIFYTSGRTWFDPVNERNQENLKNTIYEIDISDYTLFEWYAQKIQREYSHKLKSFIQIWFFARTQNTLNGLKLFKSNIKFPKDLVKPKSVYITLNASFIKINYANFIKDKFGDNYIGILDNLTGLANTPYNQTIKDNEYKLKHILLQNLISIMDLNEKDIHIDFESLEFKKYKKEDIEWHKKKIDEGWNSIKEKPELVDYKLDRLIEILSKKEKFDIEKDFEDIQEILDIYRIFLGYGKIDFLELRYEPFLSSGGEQLINLISKVYLQIEEKIKIQSNDKFILLVLDEPDIYLHPNWQKQFINIVIAFLEKNYQDIKFHIIFTTHSPFLLSDTPKENTIFLDTYDKKSKEKYPNLKFDNFKDGDCINATKEINIKLFGANIHNLLSHGFFMDNGLIGEFAQNKIQEVIDFLKDKESKIKSSNEAKKIINIIGEPFLKMQIEDLYKKKFPETLELDKQIEKLEQELKRLKNAKNRN